MTFDFRHELGISVRDIGAAVGYREAIDLVAQLSLQSGTRTHASVNGWAWPATYADLVQMAHAEWFMNVHRDTKVAPKQITLPRPWTDKPSKEDVTEEERARLEAILIASSPFGNS